MRQSRLLAVNWRPGCCFYCCRASNSRRRGGYQPPVDLAISARWRQMHQPKPPLTPGGRQGRWHGEAMTEGVNNPFEPDVSRIKRIAAFILQMPLGFVRWFLRTYEGFALNPVLEY